MKQLKLMLLMAFFSLGFSSISFGQSDPANQGVGGSGGGGAVANNTVTRYKCSGLPGCSGKEAVLILKSGVAKSHTYYGTALEETYSDYPITNTIVQVKIDGVLSIGTYKLPTTIGETLVMTGSECGWPAYNVVIKKIADKQFTFGVFYSNQ